MRYVEREFSIYSIVLRAFAHGLFDVDDEIARGAFFAGNWFAAEADDIGRAVFAEKFTVVLRNPSIVRQEQVYFLPDGFRIVSFQCGCQFSG